MPTFLGCWPVLDDGLTVDELRVEADDDLVALAWQQGVVLLEEPTWHIREGHVEGYESPTGLYLCCEAPARPHDHRVRLAEPVQGIGGVA